MSHPPKPAALLTIGALARATGVPAETLRTWERRYGFPDAERTTTGHRRYSQGTLQRLRLVRAAVQLGHRPSVALTASEPELHVLLTHRQHEATSEEPPFDRATVARWVELVQHCDGRSLDHELGSSLASLGVQRLLTERVGPLLREIGVRWGNAEVGVRHEHFASERLNTFLARHRQPLSDAATGPVVVCATPAGERHALGLQMVALTLALNNLRVVYLGPDVPAEEISQAVRQHAASAVVLSAAAGVDRERAHAECRHLRRNLGEAFPIVVGGRGFDEPPSGSTHLPGLPALDGWAHDLTLAASLA